MHTQAISILTLSVVLAADTIKGTWLTATGEAPDGKSPVIGITQADGKKGEQVSVTTLGTASMALANIATGAVKAGDVVVYDDSITIVRADQSAQYAGKIIGVVLHDAHQNSHAEILIRQS